MIISLPSYLNEHIKASPEDELELWVAPGVPGPLALAREDVVIYTSFLCDEIEAFTACFCEHYRHLSGLTWRCIILHEQPGFQIHAAVGCIRLIQEHGGNVSACLLPANAPVLEYYSGILNQFRIPVTILSDLPPLVGGHPLLPYSKPIFERNGGEWVQNTFSRPYWQSWEGMEPHAQIGASCSNFPLYCSPGIVLMLMNIIDHWQPSVILDVNAWKFGTTALMCKLSHYIGSEVWAANPKGLRDDGWFAALKEKTWAGQRATLIHWDQDKLSFNPPDKKSGTGILAFINVHTYACIDYLTDLVRQRFDHGVFVYHASEHGDMPRFISSLRDKAGMRPVQFSYRPPGGTWCENGVFQFGG